VYLIPVGSITEQRIKAIESVEINRMQRTAVLAGIQREAQTRQMPAVIVTSHGRDTHACLGPYPL
jgi:hypothetical protein